MVFSFTTSSVTQLQKHSFQQLTYAINSLIIPAIFLLQSASHMRFMAELTIFTNFINI